MGVFDDDDEAEPGKGLLNGQLPIHPSEVALAALAHNPFNPRTELTEIEEKAESFRQRGQLQPLAVVTKTAFLKVHPDQEAALGTAAYVVIDGNRRLAAASVAELGTLRIDVNNDLAETAADLLESALIANVQRVDVAPIDQAKALQELVKVHGSQGTVAKRLGKTPAWVSQRLSLLGLTDELQEKVETGELKVEPARRIARMPQEEQAAEAVRTLNAVKPPRQRRAKNAAKATVGSALNGSNTSESGGSTTAPPPTALNAVNSAPDLPWDDPEWFDRQLRAHMTPENLDRLIGLLQAEPEG